MAQPSPAGLPAYFAAPESRLPDVQATVRTYDPVTQSGTVLFDDGLELPFDGDAFVIGGLRHVRLGQRVRLRTEGSGEALTITALTLATLPLPD